jgi:uncharacterized protein (UPF0332 family)
LIREVRAHIEKARQSLGNARRILAIGLGEEAGRLAYLAAFHAAQAYIFEKTGTVAKTHSGVHGAFGKLAKDDENFDAELRKFLSRAFELKTIADYDTEMHVAGILDRAGAAIETAERFVARASASMDAAE